MPRLATFLRGLNTHAIGLTGLSLGIGSLAVGIIASLRAFFVLLSSPTELSALYFATMTHHDPTGSVAALVGSAVTVIGSFTLFFVAALLLCFFGRPTTIPQTTSKT
jgi:hypothetical protein